MKPIHLLIQVVLVVAGIFLYDTLREDPAPLPTETAGGGVAPALPVRPSPQAVPETAGLASGGDQAVARRLEQLERAQEQLRRTMAAYDEAMRTGAVPRGPAPTFRAPDDWDTARYPRDPDGRAEFEPADLSWFRALKDEVQRVERRERDEKMVELRMDRLALGLEETTHQRVVELTLDYQESQRLRLQWSAENQEDKELRMKAMRELGEEYGRGVRDLLQGIPAKRVVETFGRYPGFLPGTVPPRPLDR